MISGHPPIRERQRASAVDVIRERPAGRLSPAKGIYSLLEALHIDIIEQDPRLTFTPTAQAQTRSSAEASRWRVALPAAGIAGDRSGIC